MFEKTTLNEIRDRIPISSLVGERVQLKRSGRNLKGLCPFHQEKTPSFMVSDEKQIYHCFGCGEGGDVFRFMMKFDGITFVEAVKYLAERAGVDLPKVSDYDATREKEQVAIRRKLLRVNEIARDFFFERLRDERAGIPAREYLQHRGISGEFSTQLFLGYADNSWNSLTDRLESKGVPMNLAVDLGLVRKRPQGEGYYDFFRNRLIFPIVSPRGEIVGFGGRDLGGDGEEAKAKYINSPDSALYHKSACVYGLYEAARAIRGSGQVIIVEGYMDRLSLAQAGIENVVAPLGTAVTTGHIRLLARYAKNMVLIFDGDEAGRRAAMRSLPIFIEAGMMPRAVVLPEGHDPDTFVIERGREAMDALIGGARSLFDFFVEETLAETGFDSHGKAQALKAIGPMLASIDDGIDRGILAEGVARRLDVDAAIVVKALSNGVVSKPAAERLPDPKPSKSRAARIRGGAMHVAEISLIELMLRHPEMAAQVFGQIGAGDFEDEWCRGVAEVINAGVLDGGKPAIGEMIDALGDLELAAELRAIAMADDTCSDDEAKELLADCIASIKSKPLKERLKKINEDIRSAESAGDDGRVMDLLKEKRELTAQGAKQ